MAGTGLGVERHVVTLAVIDPAGLDRHLPELARSLGDGTVGSPDEGRRAAAPDERPDDDEPPHLQGGSPHEDRPAPSDDG